VERGHGLDGTGGSHLVILVDIHLMQACVHQHVCALFRVDVGRSICTGSRPTLMNSTSGFAAASSMNTGAMRWHGPHLVKATHPGLSAALVHVRCEWAARHSGIGKSSAHTTRALIPTLNPTVP
jgi:hypothetical protein